MTATAPTQEQQDRARWDLLLLDIEQRTEQLRQMRDPQRDRLLLLELDQRTEQVRQMKAFEGPRLIIQAITAAAAVFAAGGVVGGLLVRLLGGH